TKAGQYVVEVTQAGGCSSSFSAPFTVSSASGSNPPDPASGLLASALSSTSVLVTWNQNPTPVHNEVNFEIYQATKSGGPWTLVATTPPDLSKDTITGLTPGSTYFYEIRAVDSTGAAAVSNVASASTIADTQAPTAPGNLTITGTTYNSVSLSWTASTDNVGVLFYDIYVNGTKSYSLPNTQTNFTVYSLQNQQNYVFVVKARDAAGNVSIPSNQANGQALLNGIPYNYYNGIPTTQSNLPNFSTMPIAFSGMLPNISLSPQIDNTGFGFLFQGFINIPTTGTYTFQISSDDGSAMWLGKLNGTGSPYVFGTTPTINDDGLHGTQSANSSAMTLQAGIYPIAIAYFQQGGGFALTFSWKTPGKNTFSAVPNSAFQQTATQGAIPAAPSNLKATALSYKSIQLNWTDNSTNETGFEIWRSTSPNNSGAAILTTTGAGATSFIDSTASASTQYFYEVRAVNANGVSLFTSNYTEAEFKFNGNYIDSTGNGHTLTPINTPTFDATNKQEGSSSVKLNGTNQAITINNTGGWLQENYAQRTIAAWVKASATTGANRVIWDIGGSTNGLSLVLNNTTLEACVASGSSRKQVTTTMNNTNWNHIAVVYNGDSLLLYVNGILAASTTTLTFHSIATTSDGARIGQTNGTNALNTTGGFFGGWIDDFGVYNTALSADVVKSLMNFTYGQSNATTSVLPAVPSMPTNLSVTASSASAVNISWQDTATNVSNFKLYRSANNDQTYVLIATLPASTFSYKDTGLFANAKYYYKVDANNVGGSSAFTPEGSATTLDIPPVVNPIANQQVRYGTTTILNVSATLATGGTLTLTASNLPSAFASFTDNGNGTGKITFNPQQSDSGSYNGLTVTATDAAGGSGSTQFNILVNHNFAPTLAAIGNYTLNEGDTLTIPLVGHDSTPTDVLTYAVTNAPSNFTINQGSQGIGSLFLSPSFVSAGSYNVQVTLNDNNGLSASQTFTVTVRKKSPIQKIYTRVQYQAVAPAPWNNLTGTVTNNLKDQNGSTTNVGITFNPTNWWMPYNGGPVTGNNSGVYPDPVLQEYYYFGFFNGPANPNVVLSGLDTSKAYDVTLFASSVLAGIGDNGITSYSSEGQTVQLEVQDNLQNTVTLDSLKPAADGTITVSLNKVTSYPPGYLNALVLANHFNSNTPPASPNNLTAQLASGGVNLSWNDIAYNETSYQVYRSINDTSHYVLAATLPADDSVFTDTAMKGNSLYYYKVNCSNNIGASGFTNQVSITTPDKAPTVTGIPNLIVNNTSDTTITITAVDNNGPGDQLTLTAGGLPQFASFVDNGNGTGTLTITPTAGLSGTFPNISITATDLQDSSSTTSFTLNVIDASISYTYLNFTNPNNVAPAPWNNMVIGYIPFAGYQYINLSSQTGVPTGITVTLTDAWTQIGQTGMKRRNGSDLYPESVEASSIYATDGNTHRITITGLNPALQYNFQFFSSHFTSESTLTNFTANGQTVSLDGSQNSNKTAQLNGITPDNTGTVVITAQRATGAVYAMLSSLVIESYTPGNTTPFSPADLRKLDYAKTGKIALQWQDRSANETGFELWRAPHGGTYTLYKTLPANTTSYVDSALPLNTAYDYAVRAVNGTLESAFSNPVEGYTYQSTVYICLNRVWAPPYNFPAAPAPFNNTLWIYQALGTVWNNFTDENGLPTNIGLVQPVEWDEVDPFGVNTGNNSGVFPDAAMDQGWLDFVGDSSYVTLTGLDASKQYDITVFASCTDDNTANSSAVYHLSSGQAGILNAHLNSSGTLTFFNVTPDGTGNLGIGVRAYDSANASFGILGTIVVKGHAPFAAGISQPPVSTQESTTTDETHATAVFTMPSQDSIPMKPLSAYPNPFDQTFNLLVPATMGDDILVSITDASGKTLIQQRFEGLNQGDNVIPMSASQQLVKGVYFVKVTYLNKNQQQVLKVIKR
ncbi:MAG TPA: fibronectin type III domain-containing protein, partial [Puia sp.]|nr:fibronectin type III domain-containing protein [Puia sp.]